MKGLGVRDGCLKLSNEDGHGYTTIEAYKHSDSFFSYIKENNLIEMLLRYVAEADIKEEKHYMAHLTDQYPDIAIWSNQTNPDEVQHCFGGVCKNLCEDPRLHDSVQCLKLALERKYVNPNEAIRILANGMHMIQDYFVHLNAPGIGNTGVSHGVSVMIDSDGDEIPDTYAGCFVDNINWDCHSNNQNFSEQYDAQSTDLFQPSYWHYHDNRSDCWRFLAAMYTTANYMDAYATNNCLMYIDVLTNGFATNGEVAFYINLLSKAT